jgi:3-deoxy-D-manno-octulosonic-acid transferase
MRRSLSLFMYLLFRKLGPAQFLPAPEGEADPVVWVAAHDTGAVRAFINLSKKFEQTGISVQFLITAPDDVLAGFKPQPGITFSPFPSERPSACRAFLDQWKPILGFWVGTPLLPSLLHIVGRRQIPMVLLNATVSTGTTGNSFFHRRAVGRSMGAFQIAFTNNYASGGACIRLGIPEASVHVTGPLAEGSVTLACDNAELDELSAKISKREIWFAANVPDDELEYVLAAHETLRGTNRRLLLALNLSEAANSETLAIALAAKGWRVAIGSKGDVITDQTQIYLTDSAHERGLWFRLAPISFLGGTFSASEKGMDPRQAAALGSAIIHGPRTAPHRDSFDRMHGLLPPAATQVVSPDNLARAISELLSPDVAAAQANSAWEFVSRGAELTDQLIALIVEAAELAEAKDA